MDLRQLEMFLAVAENNSFTRASEELHVAQSAISRKIKMLEEELGTLLFKRVNKKIYLTGAGETLLRYSRRIFQDIRNAAMEVSEIGQIQRGEARVAAGLIACMYILPPVLQKFRQSYPGIDLKVVTGPTEDLLNDIRQNAIDLGLLTAPIDYPDLEVIPLFTEELVVVTSPDHPKLSKRSSIRSRELENHALILFHKRTHTRQVLDRLFRESGIVPKVTMEAENVATIKPLVRVNLGITVIPLRAVLEEVQRKELHFLKIQDRDWKRQLALVYQRTEPTPRVVSELVRLFEEFRDEG